MDITEISDRMELEKLVTDYATAVDNKNFQAVSYTHLRAHET